MLQINAYNLASLSDDLNQDIEDIDKLILSDLIKISKISVIKQFSTELDQLIGKIEDFSFVKATIGQINELKKINTSISITSLTPFNKKFKELAVYLKNKRKKKNCSLNDILEFIFGYHLESRTQVLKRVFKIIDMQNCVYCLAQYTTAYGVDRKKIYVKGNLDHIYPKSLNALISLSINNLVPVCAHCNQRKLNASVVKFNFNPFDLIAQNVTAKFKFDKVLNIENNSVFIKTLADLKIENINPTLEKRLDLTTLYKEYKSVLDNLLERYNKFNSIYYGELIDGEKAKVISNDLEYFISEVPYTVENIQNIPLHKFKSDFYRELEACKNSGKIKFS